MNADLEALARRLDRDPADPLAVQALADWLEERGADALAVRAIAVDGPTVLVVMPPDLGFAAHLSPEEADHYCRMFREIAAWLSQKSGHPVNAVVLHRHMEIREIRAQLRAKEGGGP